ncbi:MAG: CDGSH iron-sulfur domain-containing protein [Bacteroidales bacterium]|nr:CDGSH iron-sulfur domain-containing protein [Bacteroidales bacterium]
MNSTPKKGPYAVDLEAGKEYYWCACGKSKNQPFCDGSHQGSNIVPLAFKAAETGKVYLCGCKRTQKPPFCDGTHTKL